MVYRLTWADQSKINEASKFLLGFWRVDFSKFYSKEELLAVYDRVCNSDVLSKWIITWKQICIVSEDVSHRINGVIFWQAIIQQNAVFITQITVEEKRRGIGKILLARFEKEFPVVDFYIAQIREANIPSQRLFESAWYRHDGYTNEEKNTRNYYKDITPYKP